MSRIPLNKPAMVAGIARVLLAKVVSAALLVSVVTRVEAASDLSAVATTGEPYGVGLVEVPMQQALEMGWYGDQALEVSSPQSSIWLPACRESVLVEEESTTDPSTTAETLRVYFLFSEGFPNEIELAFPRGGKVRATANEKTRIVVPHRQLLQEWWSALGSQSYREISGPLVAATEDFLNVLGRKLGLKPESDRRASAPTTSQLEKQFERSVGMLLGFESVRLAMMIDDEQQAIGHAPALQPLPAAVQVASSRLLNTASHRSPRIENIALMVPMDCYYVRCGSMQNYTWLRRLLTNWGGSLDEIVTSPCIDADVRGRLEAQLGVESQLALQSGIDELLSDMAIIGTDLFFDEGAGIGVLLEARPGQEQRVEAMIQQHRAATAERLGAVQQTELLNGSSISYLRTNDHRMRSFFVRIGRYLLITNSQALMKSVLRLKTTSTQSLANLPEYRFAIASHHPARQASITIYLSDPFFRRITSAAYRVELGRRRASARDCRQLEIAAVVARAFGHPAETLQLLVQGEYLPEDFGLRPDGSQVELVAGEALDTLRGRAGTFVPVGDIPTDSANQNEIQSYQNFSRRYAREWRAMDPVLAWLTSRSLNNDVDRVQMHIHVTPYARNEYAFLTAYLAQPTFKHVGITGMELMGVSANLRNRSQLFLAHLGLCDAEVPFQVRSGKLQRLGTHASESFVRQRSFAAVTPAGSEGLRVLNGLIKSLQTRASPPVSSSALATLSSPSLLNPLNVVKGLFSPSELAFQAGEATLKGILGLASLGAITEDDEWSIYGTTSELRDEVRQRLVIQHHAEPAAIHFHAGGIEHAAVAPYLHAYAFCAARQQSAAVAAWLNRWTVGLRDTPQGLRERLEKAVGGEFACPLGGQYFLRNSQLRTPQWSSSKWNEASLSKVDRVPDDFRFPFLQWLKHLELNFNLTASSLDSDIMLNVARTLDADMLPISLK